PSTLQPTLTNQIVTAGLLLLLFLFPFGLGHALKLFPSAQKLVCGLIVPRLCGPLRESLAIRRLVDPPQKLRVIHSLFVVAMLPAKLLFKTLGLQCCNLLFESLGRLASQLLHGLCGIAQKIIARYGVFFLFESQIPLTLSTEIGRAS